MPHLQMYNFIKMVHCYIDAFVVILNNNHMHVFQYCHTFSECTELQHNYVLLVLFLKYLNFGQLQ